MLIQIRILQVQQVHGMLLVLQQQELVEQEKMEI